MEEENDFDPRDKPATVEETVGVVDVPRREMPAREHPSPPPMVRRVCIPPVPDIPLYDSED